MNSLFSVVIESWLRDMCRFHQLDPSSSCSELTQPTHLGKKTNWYSWSLFLRLKQKTCCQLERAPEFWCPGTRTLVPFQVDNRYFIVISRMGISNINLSFSQVYLCFPDFSWFYQNTVSICEDTQPRKHRKNCGGTRVLVPGHQNSGALSSWQEVFCFNLKNGHQEYHFVFFPNCIYVFPTFPVFIGTLPA